MASSEPLSADGTPLRRPAPADGWAEWSRWAHAVEKRVAGIAAQRKLVGDMLDTIEKMAAAIVDERRERARLAAEVDKLLAELGTQRTLAEITARLDRIDRADKIEAAAGGGPEAAAVQRDPDVVRFGRVIENAAARTVPPCGRERLGPRSFVD